MRTGWLSKIKEEVIKQLKVGFIKPVHQAEWITNVVPLPKKDGKVRMYVDFGDLNNACPKDDFPEGKSGFVSHTKLTAEATFMDLFHS